MTASSRLNSKNENDDTRVTRDNEAGDFLILRINYDRQAYAYHNFVLRLTDIANFMNLNGIFFVKVHCDLSN